MHDSIDTQKTRIRIPIVVLISLLCSAAASGMVWGVMQNKVNQVAAFDAESRARDLALQVRVEKLEVIANANRGYLERIDERTKAITSAIDRMDARLEKHMEQK